MPTGAAKFDHVVVLMFENRSFDNLLGYLYQPGEVPSFEGVVGRNLANPIPSDFVEGGVTEVPVHPATNMDTPDPDPGEEYPHVNTQLFGVVEPPTNRFSAAEEMASPFNAPADPTPTPTMKGFVADYINAFLVEVGRAPRYEEYAQIMACYTPEQIPVFSTLAREFACFDHWFCEVPSQTFTNRSFFHAASSSGLVVNAPVGSFGRLNDAPTIFERLQDAGRSWKVYIDPGQVIPATALIHAQRLAPYYRTNFVTMSDFYAEARAGQLPDYAFIEPNMVHPHADMHPPGAAKMRLELHLKPPQSMANGERLLAQVYEAVRTSDSRDGSNYANTLLLVTFDEHGGTFDHVPPPPAPPPGDTARQQEGFRFDRSGVRIPTIAISAWVEPRTVINREFRSASVIRTLRERWSLGGPLTGRDAAAPDLAPILVRDAPRPVSEWPRVTAKPLSPFTFTEYALERMVTRLEKDIVGEALFHEAGQEQWHDKWNLRGMVRRDLIGHLTRIQRKWFPGVAKGQNG